MTILKFNFKNFKAIIKKLTEEIERGKVIVCPTDTLYGLIADATNKKAVEKLFRIKKRRTKKPIPIFVQNLKEAKELAKIDKKQEKFLRKVWPGKVTVVLKKKKTKVKLYGVSQENIALRIPKYKLILDLLKKVNCPLTGTSANISAKPATTKIKEVLNQFNSQETKPSLVIDAGNLKSSKPSMVIDLTGSVIKILRK